MTETQMILISILLIVFLMFVVIALVTNPKTQKIPIKFPENNREADSTYVAIEIGRSKTCDDVDRCWDLIEDFQHKYFPCADAQYDVEYLTNLWKFISFKIVTKESRGTELSNITIGPEGFQDGNFQHENGK